MVTSWIQWWIPCYKGSKLSNLLAAGPPCRFINNDITTVSPGPADQAKRHERSVKDFGDQSLIVSADKWQTSLVDKGSEEQTARQNRLQTLICFSSRKNVTWTTARYIISIYPRLPKTVYFTAVLTKTVYWGRRFIFPFFVHHHLVVFSPFSTSNRHSQSLGPVILRFWGYPNPRQKTAVPRQ